MQSDFSRWDALDDGKYSDETMTVRALLARQPLSSAERETVAARAVALVEAARASQRKQGVVESFLQQFSLGTREGLALMCLAEALLRTPDADTRDRLIAEKIGSADWASHLGQSDSLFVNASTWGLMLTGKLVDVEDEARRDLPGFLKRLTAKLGEPVIRQAVGAAVRMMGEQFVLGRDIDSALARAKREDLLCSFDMLGEGARTAHDAERYERIYAHAIAAVGKARRPAQRPEDGHGISVKLSALCPRYEAVQEARVWRELYPRLKRLALIAAHHDLNLAIDAEEADRLVISLKLVDRLARETELGSWTGLGVVVQAYQKRGLAVIGALQSLSAETGRRIMVRLVKGAYWDSEIKRAQVAGRPGYPVFTTKPATDLSYLACADALIAASPALYPQFATHNAHTLAAVRLMAERARVPIEHQRLHGMGEALYAVAGPPGEARLRAYAPVGGHEELLPYLVRRLLENGANTSFVHALLNDAVPAALVVSDPIAAVEAAPGAHPKIALPGAIYGPLRDNPIGRDYSVVAERHRAAAASESIAHAPLTAGPIVGGEAAARGRRAADDEPGRHEGAARRRQRGDLRRTSIARPCWPPPRSPPGIGSAGGAGGACCARWAMRWSGTWIAWWHSSRARPERRSTMASPRCAKQSTSAVIMPGSPSASSPRRRCSMGRSARSTASNCAGAARFACISPWNFPLAIFTGQIAAALAAGNAVLAKPAEQTPFVAAEAVRLFHGAGLDSDLLALLPGEGASVGAALVSHPLVAGVAFTGGTDTARAINRALAERPGAIIPLIAETGGLNGLFADTTALKEQVVDDVIASAIGSAGQRCSALRILFLPRDSAEELIETLCGALDTLVIGDPADPATDIGPVIDTDARAALEAHVARLEREARILHRLDPGEWANRGSFFGPVIAEVPHPDFLEREVFGPILHVYRYDPEDLADVAGRLAARGYGLTLGVHSRIERFAEEVRALVPAGNVYVNRSITGAVVGVQPFGGEGLSGTGPKAGGPHALLRHAVERALSVNITAQGGDPALLNL